MVEPGGRARKVTILVESRAGVHGKATYLHILDWLKAEGAAGAAAFKAIASLGPGEKVQTLRLADVAPDLPVMIVWIDTPERVERLVPRLREMVHDGLIAIEDTEVVLAAAASVPALPRTLTVGEVMTRDVVTVHPDTPMSEVVADLVERRFRAVPVVDAGGRVAGMITNGDLVRRGGLPIRVDLLRTFETPDLHDELARLGRAHREASEVMTTPALTTTADTDVRQAAQMMCRTRLKRLPVVSDDGMLIGIVSRIDLLRGVAGKETEPGQGASHPIPAAGTAEVKTIMSLEVPTVPADAPVADVVRAITSTRLNRAVVVDDQRHVVGIVTDSELVERLAPHERRGLLKELTDHLPFVHPSSEEQETARLAHAGRARQLMQTNIVVATEDEPIRDVLAAMLRKGKKIVPIVDGSGRLVGLVDRADLLGVLAER